MQLKLYLLWASEENNLFMGKLGSLQYKHAPTDQELAMLSQGPKELCHFYNMGFTVSKQAKDQILLVHFSASLPNATARFWVRLSRW